MEPPAQAEEVDGLVPADPGVRGHPSRSDSAAVGDAGVRSEVKSSLVPVVLSTTSRAADWHLAL
eukprot:3653868-Pyramimonas_sp.AAC.1